MLSGGRGNLRPHRFQLAADCGGVERQVGIRPEDVGKMVRNDLAQHDIAIRDRQRPAPPIAGRPRDRASRMRANLKARAVEGTNGSTPCGNRVDAHHRRADAHAGHHRFAFAFIMPGIVRHVGRRAPHVKADDMRNVRLRCGLRHSDNAACRPRQDRVLALEPVAAGKPAIGLHEQGRDFAASVGLQLPDIMAQHR